MSTWIDAAPQQVWDVASDIHQMAESSPELQRVEWTDGATGPGLGARFIGHNEHPAYRCGATPAWIRCGSTQPAAL